jgi:hypothetical protein
MDNAQKAIMIGVGLFVTILIIAAVMLIVNPAISLINNATNRVTNLSDALQQQLTQEYDDVTVTGAKVISTIQLYCTDQDMILEVQPTVGGEILELGKVRGDGTTSIAKALNYDSSHEQTKVSALSNSSNTSTYVPASARYDAQLIRSSNGDSVLGIIFTRAK